MEEVSFSIHQEEEYLEVASSVDTTHSSQIYHMDPQGSLFLGLLLHIFLGGVIAQIFSLGAFLDRVCALLRVLT